MFTYQIRRRTYRTPEGNSLSFPSTASIRFEFLPSQPFGTEPGNGHTAVVGLPAKADMDLNTGKHSIVSSEPLSPLRVLVAGGGREFRLEGTTLTFSDYFDSLEELDETINGIYFALPMLLNISFADPPYVSAVSGQVANVPFHWELVPYGYQFSSTTQDDQERDIERAWERMFVIGDPQKKRLAAGLHYFHVACRLLRSGQTPGEFVSEAILNLSKALEVLFPPEGDGKTMDAVRLGLQQLEYTKTEIEKKFIPMIALRNQIDVGHVELGIFSVDQLSIIHTFTEKSEVSFRGLMDRVITRVESGDFKLQPYEVGPARTRAINIIERMRESDSSSG